MIMENIFYESTKHEKSDTAFSIIKNECVPI